MKFNLTNQIDLPTVSANYPTISDWTIIEIVLGSLYYNWVSIITSFICYYPIVIAFKKIIPSKNVLRLIVTGITLSLTTPLLYTFMANFNHNDYYIIKPEIIAWSLTFTLSVIFYYLLNKPKPPAFNN